MTQLKIKLVKEIVSKKRKVKEVSEILEVSRQIVSKWKAQYLFGGEAELLPKKSGPKNGTTWNKTSDKIENMIVEIAKKNPYKGPDWIADTLNIQIDQSTVYRILKRKEIRYYHNYKHSRRKKKRYCLDTPGRELQLDVCFPFGYARKEVVYDVIDDCSRWVFAKVMSGHNTHTTISFLEQLLQAVPFNIKAIRTDQGREFPKAVTEWLEERGIDHRRNPPYTPQHNGKIERYHRTFKENSACYWSFRASTDELNFELKKWLHFYNYQKKHTGLGMNKLTPVQKISYVILHDSFRPSKKVNLTLQQYNV